MALWVKRSWKKTSSGPCVKFALLLGEHKSSMLLLKVPLTYLQALQVLIHKLFKSF